MYSNSSGIMRALLILCTIVGAALFYVLMCLLGSLFTDLPLFSVLNAIVGLFVLVGVSIIIVILTAIIQVIDEVR